MVSVLASSAEDPKVYEIGICYAALRRKSKDGLARNQNNVSEWSDMSTCGLLLQWATQGVGLVQSELHHHPIEN
jgi:hypothetical protein